VRIGEAKNETDLLQALDEAYERRLQRRRGFETVWWNNIALVSGDHYAQWNPTQAIFEERDPSFDDWAGKKPRMVINHALTIARTELSKLTKARPIMEVLANSDESTDIAAAKVGRAALDFAEWKFKVPKQRKSALWWMIQCGLGAIFVGYDYMNDQSGHFTAVYDPETGEPTFDPARVAEIRRMMDQGELDEVKVERYPLGDLELKVYSPFQLLPDETALEFDLIKDLITEEVQDIDVLAGIYGSRETRNLRPEGNLQLGVLEQRMLARAGVVGEAAMASKVDNACRVKTFWLLPGTYAGNKFLKDGVCVRWTHGRNVLDFSKVFPFDDGRMPFAFFQHIPSASTIWPDSVMGHVRGPNLEIDKTVSQLIENKDYMANPMWLIATQHKIKGEVKNVAGAIVRYRHVPNVPPPTPVQGMQMPQQVENLLAGLREQILEISGQSEVARGRVPQGARSGVAVAYMQEEDDTKIAPTVENMEESISLMGSLILSRFGQFYTFERIIRFYRRDGAFDVRRFKGADLKNNTDVMCQAGSAMPRSKAARQQYTLELISLGVLKDPHKIEQMLEIGEGEPDDTDKSIAQANRENNAMLFGTFIGQSNQSESDRFERTPTAIPVKSWHNHQVHIQRHTSAMMDEEFDQLAISHPEIVRLFDEHLAMHQQELQKQQMAQMQQLLAAKGAPDGPPGNSGAPTPGGNGNGVGPGELTPGVLATGGLPDVIGGGALSLHTRGKVGPTPGR
jgi:hypothetical protein